MASIPPKIDTPYGHAMPPAPRHSVTVHIATWASLMEFAENPMAIIPSLKSLYPRMMPHEDIRNLTAAITKIAGVEGKACFLFNSLQSALECKEYATSPLRSKPQVGHDPDDTSAPVPTPAKSEDVEIRVYEAESRIYAVFFPADKAMMISGFWLHAGVGMSSRMAEQNLKYIDNLKQVSLEDDADQTRHEFDGPSHKILQERISGLLNRAPVNAARQAKVSPDDVHLFLTGMGGIYKLHTYLLGAYNQTTVLFGMAFHSTPHVFDEYGPGHKFFGFGTDAELDDLEAYLEAEAQEGRKVQAVFAEFPSNPLPVTPNLTRLRALADKFDFVLCIDDTLASFANVDLLDVADVLITSLTKSFSGYADVIAGGVVLNPASHKYTELKTLFKQNFVREFYHLDADVLEHNSRDYLSRSTILNRNAALLSDYFDTLATQKQSIVTQIFYPPHLASYKNYTKFMRPATAEFTPGFGCLFAVQFEDVAAMSAFYDNLHVHCGPHLGAHLTLALPYTGIIYAKQLKWANQYGMSREQIRISVGLEDSDVLLRVFQFAVEAAEKDKLARTHEANS